MAASTTDAEDPGYPGEIPSSHGIVGSRPDWLRPHMGWAMVGAVAGWFFGRYVGDLIASGWPVSQNTTMNNVAVVLGLCFGVLGWLIGIGALTYPIVKMFGREPAPSAPHAFVGALFPHDRGPQSRRDAVPHRSARLPVHRWAVGDGDSHGAS